MDNRRQSGLALIAAVILITILALLAAVMANMAASSHEIATEFLGGYQSFYLAEAGLELAKQHLQQTKGCPPTDPTLPLNTKVTIPYDMMILNLGSFHAEITYFINIKNAIIFVHPSLSETMSPQLIEIVSQFICMQTIH